MPNEHQNYTSGQNDVVSKFIPRWHQPINVLLLMLALVATSFYSLQFAPACIQAAALNQLADESSKKDDFTTAEIKYRAALKLKPEANSVRVGLALVLFRQQRHATDLEALTLLERTILTPSEKVKVINAMPEQYRSQFLEAHLQ